MRQWQLLVFAALLTGQALRQPSCAMPFAGPYIAYVDAFTQCEEHEWNHRGNLYLSVTKFNKQQPHVLQRITGNLTMDSLDDAQTWIHARMDTRSNNQWKENAFVFNFPNHGCSVMRQHLPDFFRAMYGKEWSTTPTCPRAGSTYVVNDQPVNWTFPHFPMMPYGHWRYHLTVGQASTTTICLNAECHTIPRGRAGAKG